MDELGGFGETPFVDGVRWTLGGKDARSLDRLSGDRGHSIRASSARRRLNLVFAKPS
jgi:hypothetical protein